MILYHGSTIEVVSPNPSFSRKNLDFGQGFYLTSYKDQAERWALRKAFLDDSSAVVNEYDYSDDSDDYRVLRFEDTNEEWLEFICDCRRGGQEYQNFDIIIGSVANDKVYEAVNMYFKGYWDRETTLKALRYYEKNDQYCFVSPRAINELLKFRTAYEVS